MSELNQEFVVNEKVPRKRRTAEEIATEKLEKEQKKQEREDTRIKKADEEVVRRQLKKEHNSTPLIPGKGSFAIAAMSIFELCKNNMPSTNRAFRQMIASRIIFPPKKNINKFATGGIAEECVSQMFCDVGLACTNVSEYEKVIDLRIQVPVNLEGPLLVNFEVSLKNSGTIKNSPILENYLGNKRTEIRPLSPTFIIYTEVDIKRVRIVYLDEEILRQGYPELSDEDFHAEIYANKDSNLAFKSGFMSKFIPRLPTEYILDADYPEDMQLVERNFSKLALAEVIKQLYSE